MPGADNHVEDTETMSRPLAKYYLIGICWSLASVAVLTRDLGLPSIPLGNSFTLHIDHVVIIATVYVAIVFPFIFTLVEEATVGR